MKSSKYEYICKYVCTGGGRGCGDRLTDCFRLVVLPCRGGYLVFLSSVLLSSSPCSITIHYTFPLGSWVNPIHIDRHRRSLLSWIVDPVPVLNPANVQRNVFLLEHLRDALSRTIFGHSSRRIIGHVTNSNRVIVVLDRDVAPISCRPTNKKENNCKIIFLPPTTNLPEKLVSIRHYRQYFHLGSCVRS